MLFIFVILMVLSHLLPIGKINIFPWNLSGVILIILGIIISSAGSAKFEKEGTNIPTFKDPDKLVTDGIYKLSRHPMYLGFAILLAGIAVVLSSATSLILFVIFVVITDSWYIRFEEKKMVEKFGKNYLDYRSKVRRWI